MELIETKTLGADAASIEFTSIPQTFTDLVFFASTRSSTAGTSVEPCLVSFNSNSSNYSKAALNGTGSSTSAAAPADRTVFRTPRTGTTSNTFGNSFVYVAGYTESKSKSFFSDSVTENNATEAHQTIIAGRWADNDAITSASFTPTANNFKAGSTISLYGILKGSDGIVTTS